MTVISASGVPVLSVNDWFRFDQPGKEERRGVFEYKADG